MKTNRHILIISLGLMILAGCSGIRVSQDYDTSRTFTGIQTYALQDKTPTNGEDILAENPLIDERIRTALDATLREKGYAQTTARPDIRVVHHYSIRTKTGGSSGGPNIGFMMGTSGRNSGLGLGLGTGTGNASYDEALLVIDFKTGNDEKPLWRGTSTFRVDTHTPPEEMTKKINLAVKKILAQFPPTRK